MESNLLTYDEAAAYLRINKNTLQKWKSAGRVRWITLGRRIFFTKELLDEMISQQVRGGAPAAGRRRRT
jgi:excisionase family DNA binding protein